MSEKMVSIASASLAGKFLLVIVFVIAYHRPPPTKASNSHPADQVSSHGGPPPGTTTKMAPTEEDHTLLLNLVSVLAKIRQEANDAAKAQLEETKKMTVLLEQGYAELLTVHRAPLPRGCDDVGQT
ncbi:hypothetical protein LTR78_003772 [Recurvomyces mirabilis]|uniref:Uncharacterized protein n=1 Tax=Recurvomyces mirabilis TaxID=574656 RepID=A0AAE1C389_9PEZI|nr:hypothetical protein LTR78_003772 [Recurvomyces mirabilis]KAK5154884.1 hypothetical protein LTS14_006465 [Recurvomyces mirabilis]